MGRRRRCGRRRGQGPAPPSAGRVLHIVSVLRRGWPPAPRRGAAPCGLRESVLFIGTQFSNLYTTVDTPRLVAGGGGWFWCGSETHAVRSVSACNRGPPSSTSALMSGLSCLVLPRRLWRVVGWVGFLSDVICGVEIVLWEGCYLALTLAHGVCGIVYVWFLSTGAGTVWGGGSSLHSGRE